MPAALEAQDLVKDYPIGRSWRDRLRSPFARQRRRALDGLSLRLEAGQRMALVGPNGAGKTTLARIASGVVLPDAGSARVAGTLVSHTSGWRAQVGFARPDDPGLHPRMSVLECLRFHAALYGAAASRSALMNALDRTGSAHLADRRVQTLSGGERARVSLSRAILHVPKLLILDELSRTLDPGAAARTRELLDEVARAGGAVLLITHDLSEAALCDRAAVLEAGRLVASGSWAAIEPRAREVFGL